MRARDAEKFDPAPSWLWDPARQIAVWANAPAKTLFARRRASAAEAPLLACDPIAALSNACHAMLISAGRAESGPTSVFGRQVRCKSSLQPLEGGGAGVLIEVTASSPDLAGDAGAEHPLARAAHDLRMPLTAIIGFAEFISASGGTMPEATRRDYLADIVSAGRFAARMAEDLLSYATPGATAPNPDARADLTAIARETARLLTMEAERRDVEIRISADVADSIVAANPDQMRRAVGNLAANALAHARRTVDISVRTDEADNVSIRVSDDGPGLSAEELQLALEPFGRPKAAAGSKGVGLGLPIARRFAEANGAALEIDTAPGAGFSACILFPAARRKKV